ncbi:hypothetical protein PM082_012339 [Marasmius tenuissimus]|nr:hypothetical protein PM082_012339 [Marasmius tenuissimus]
MFLPTIALGDLRESYDYIIVGGGTAGCVLANRLSQDPNVTVLLVERGGLGEGWQARIPLLSAHFASDKSRSRIWKTVPQSHLGGREVEIIGGNALGGTTRINGTIYTRGLPAEYNAWAQSSGMEDWKYEKMERYFLRSEKNLDQTSEGKHYHASTGEWPNRALPAVWGHTGHIIRATSALGLPYVEDISSPYQHAHGYGRLRLSVDSTGNRGAVSAAFLPKDLVKTRSDHLHISLHSTVHRLEIREGANMLSVEGVWIQKSDATGRTRLIKANREVILCGGAISSPHTLLLSGIGPEKHLKQHGIPVKKNMSGVGSNLQDHLSVPVQFGIPLRDSILSIQASIFTLIKELILYFLFGIGFFINASTMDGIIFLQSRLMDEDNRVSSYSKADMDAKLPKNLPDLEFLPISTADGAYVKPKTGGFTLYSVALRPYSSGMIRLASSDPFASVIIDPNYLSDERDRALLRKGIRFTYQLTAQMREQGYSIDDLHTPEDSSDTELDAFIKKECVSFYHYSSTCRMAPEEEGGVVDGRLRVYGVKGLRIADASIFPSCPSAHLAAVTVAVAEKCADMVLEDDKMGR